MTQILAGRNSYRHTHPHTLAHTPTRTNKYDDTLVRHQINIPKMINSKPTKTPNVCNVMPCHAMHANKEKEKKNMTAPM